MGDADGDGDCDDDAGDGDPDGAAVDTGSPDRRTAPNAAAATAAAASATHSAVRRPGFIAFSLRRRARARPENARPRWADLRHDGAMTTATLASLETGLSGILESPADHGVVEMIVRRPAVDEREILAEALLSETDGLEGDTWSARGSSRTEDGSPHPDMQLTLMNARVIALLAGSRDRWPEAGDQLYVDLDLSLANLPAGTRLSIGSAVIEVTGQPHLGCKKFAARFGADAVRFVNSAEGRRLNLRGINCRIVRSGAISAGDRIVKTP